MIRAPVEIWYIQRRRSNSYEIQFGFQCLKAPPLSGKSVGGLVAFIRIVLNDVQKAFA